MLKQKGVRTHSEPQVAAYQSWPTQYKAGGCDVMADECIYIDQI